MLDTFFGTKLQQTQAWNKGGIRLPITIVTVKPMTVTQVKRDELDGYQAIQIGFGAQNWQKMQKPLQGHLKKSFASPSGATSKKGPRFLREIREVHEELKVGDTVTVDQVFSIGDLVNVSGLSRGRGFAGAIKRWGFHGGPKTHGQSDRARAVGSIGQGTSPGRVHKGKKMPGHFGNTTSTVRNLTVLKVDSAKNELWLKGQIPGTRNSVVEVKKIGHAPNTSPLIDPLNPQKEEPKPAVEVSAPETKASETVASKEEKK